jgi:hypothetical protein
MAGRRPKTALSPFNSITLELWQQSDPYVKWARSDPMFSNVLAVMQNGMLALTAEQFTGYRMAVNQLLSLRIPMTEAKRGVPVDYSEPPEGFGSLPDEQVET